MGYSSVNSILSLKVPSSKGVLSGPKISAFQTMISWSVGAPVTPVGGSLCILQKEKSYLIIATHHDAFITAAIEKYS